MNKIKILHIITRLDRGGSSRIVLTLVKSLPKESYQLTIVTGLTRFPEENLEDYSYITGVKILYLNQLRRSINVVLDLISFFRLFLIIKRERPVIVHTHTSKAGILGRWAAKLAGVPIIIHMPHGHIFYGYFGRLKTMFFIFLERITASITDKIITLTEQGKSEHIKFNIAKDDKFITIHNGIEVEKYLNAKIDFLNKKRQLGIQESKPVITMIARLEPVKGHIYFLEAIKGVIKQFPEAKALIVGDGSLRKKLEDLAKKLNIFNRVIFLGERQDTLELISISDLIVLSSLNEGLGLVLLEAGILGKPVVATKVGGICEVVLDSRTGILIPPEDSQALADAILKLSKDKQLYNRMSIEAKEWVARNFSQQQMINKFNLFYEELLVNR